MLFDSSILVNILFIIFLLLLSGIFSASEISFFSLPKSRLFRLKNLKSKKAQLVYKLSQRKERLIGGILIANNLVNISASAIATGLAIRVSKDHGVIFATIVMTTLIVFFAEILPKTYAVHHPEKFAKRIVVFLDIIIKILAPLAGFIEKLATICFKLIGIRSVSTIKRNEAEEDIRNSIYMHYKEGSVVKYSKDMLNSILDLEEIDIMSVMKHRKSLFTLNIDSPNEELIEQAIKSQYSRIPVWKGEAENIIGILHIRDLFREICYNTKERNAIDIHKIIREPWFILNTISLKDQLIAFRKNRRHFACVVDEYGAILGVATLEDILEEIVGEIKDEYDKGKMDIVKKVSNNNQIYYILDGAVSIRDLNRAIGSGIPEQNVATLAGLIMEIAETIPARNAVYEAYDLRFTIIEKKQRELVKIKIEKL